MRGRELAALIDEHGGINAVHTHPAIDRRTGKRGWANTIVCADGWRRQDGWSRWVLPARNYRLACCGCGLVHDMETRVMRRTGETPDGLHIIEDEPLNPDEYVAEFRVRINRRSTGQMRRKRKART